MMIDEVVLSETKPISGDELFAVSDTGRSELVEGKIVSTSPTGDRHGGVEQNFGMELGLFVREHKLGKVRVGEVGIYIRRNPDTVRAADVLFISNERYAQRQSQGYLDVAPDLVVEVLSPSDALSEVMQKLREYFSIGVRLVWFADPRAQMVYAYRSTTDMREFAGADTMPGDDVLPGFAVPVAALFEE